MKKYCLLKCLFSVSTVLAIIDISGYAVTSASSTSNSAKSGRIIIQSNGECHVSNHREIGRWVIVSSDPNEIRRGVEANSSLKFSCYEGFETSSKGTFQGTCISGQWIGPIFTCQQLDEEPEKDKRFCPKLENTASTNVRCFDKDLPIKCDEAADESYAKFECAPYYEMAGQRNKSRYCRAGSWNLPPPECVPVCGEKSSLALLTINGKSPEVGKYPWVTAIYRKEEDSFEHICGGSILTARFVLTAAHCVSNGNGSPLDPEKIKLAAGKYYNKYNDVRAIFAQYSNVQEVLIHPNYKGNSRRYSSDIALLLTTDSFAFSKVVQPVCFRNLPHVYLTDESTGIIAGWGYTTAGQGPSEELKEISVPFKRNTTCQSSLSPDWMDVYNGYDKFCAGRYNDSIEICKGDSGNGLVFRNSQDGRFYIHGIVSVEWKLNTIGCDKQLSTLYTRVAVHYDWLEKMVAENSRF